MKDYRSYSQYIFDIFRVPIIILDIEGKIYDSFPSLDRSIFVDKFYQEILKAQQSSKVDEKQILLKHFYPDYYFIVASIQDTHYYAMIGPFLNRAQTQEQAYGIAIEMGVLESKLDQFSRMIMDILPMSYSGIMSFIHLYSILMFDKDIKDSEIHIVIDYVTDREIETNLTKRLFDAREFDQRHSTYDFEMNIMNVVKNGEMEALQSSLNATCEGTPGIMSRDSIRQARYSFVTFVSSLTRAAIEGGVDEETAFSLSDLLCQKMDSYRDLNDIYTLASKAAYTFTEKVAEIKNKALFTKTVQSCCDYINTHLHQEIYVPYLAEIVDLSPRSLAQHFKTEVGLSIVDYINQQRVNEAKSLLKYTKYTLNEISNFLLFASQSYFSMVFKRVVGMTPQAYREQRKK